ncbi:zinc finger protein 91-like [Culicoides brevitarsis]|uniref:zinc finger protein 91-like n=1 Tax=Culicoides brevitarsis TaxID=469753 RepID=UPI00307C4A2E
MDDKQKTPTLGEITPQSIIRPFICHYCGMKFDEKTHLRQHIGHRHMPRDRKCPDCDVMINDICYISHKQVHMKRHICEKCGKLFQTAKRLEVHKSKSCPKTKEELEKDPEFMAKRYKCHMCIYRGPNERALNKHVQRVHQAKNMEKEKTCEVCQKKFNKIAYTNHIRTHGKIQCQICQKFLSAGSGFFKQHMLNHEKEQEDAGSQSHEIALGPDGVFRCYAEACDYETPKKRLFVRHYQNKHGPKLLKCDFPECKNTELMSEKQLWRHKNSHKRKDCEKCGAIFNELRDLRRHLAKALCNMTKDSQPFEDLKCEQCDYTTYQSNALVRHRLHYHAPVVGRCQVPGCKNPELMTKAKLAIHMGRHKEHKKKKYECEICGWRFGSSWNLKKHSERCEYKQKLEKEMNEKVEVKEEPKEENDKNDSEEEENEFNNNFETEIQIKIEPPEEIPENPLETFQIDIKEEPPLEINEEYETKSIKSECDSNVDDPFQSSSDEVKTITDPLSLVKCRECKEFRLTQHVKRRHPEMPNIEDTKDFLALTDEQLTCRQCERECLDIFDYRNHLREAHAQIEYKCDKCDYVSDKKKNLGFHIYMVHDPNQVECEICSKKVNSTLLTKHMKRHTLPHKCSACPERFSGRWILKAHILKWHPNREDLIAALNEDIKSNKNSRKIEVSEAKPIQCDHCNYKTANRVSFFKHFQRMHSLDRVNCEICGNSVSRIDLKRHNLTHENPSTKNFMCERCSRTFKQERSLEVHRISCIGQVQFKLSNHKCDQCDHTTGTKKGLRNHKYSVHAPKDAQCPVCQKWMTKMKLSGHMRCHVKRIACVICEKSNFATSWHLKVHILKVHPGNEHKIIEEGLIKKPRKIVTAEGIIYNKVECPECKKMVRETRLSVHMMIHNKRFSCPNEGCESMFAHQCAIKTHLLTCRKRQRDPEEVNKRKRKSNEKIEGNFDETSSTNQN